MTSKRMWVAICILVVVGLLMGGFGCAKPAEERPKTLTVGLSASMSGPAAAWGIVHDHAVTLAIEDINTKGGITVGGEKYLLDLKTYDHAYDPAKATEIAKRMVTMDRVTWIVTHGATVTKPIIPYTEETKTLLMQGATGKDVMVFQKQNYTFRWLITTSPEAMHMVWDWVSKNRTDIKTTAEIKPDDASGWDEAKDTKEMLPKYGIKLVNESFYKRGTTDFYPVLTSLLAAKPDSIDLGAIPPADQGRIIKQSVELGFKGRFIAPVAPSLAPVLDLAKEAAEGLILGSYIDPTSPLATSGERAFYDRWVQAYGLPFDYLSLGIVAGVYPVAQAMERINSLDPDKIAKELETGTFDVLGRKVRFGGVSVYGEPARQIIAPLAICSIEGGKLKVLGVADMPAGY